MKTRHVALLAAFCMTLPGLTALAPAADTWPEEFRSPVNQVFQFTQSGECSAWPDGSTTKATAYLWIPEKCQKLRGLLVMCSNVPEHMLVGHPTIRSVCTAHDLGIVFFPSSFYNFKAKDAWPTDVAFLQQILDGLAKTSGYDEVATVPWLPLGESGHLLMVNALVEAAPQRCIAGVWLKNNDWAPKNREVPALTIYGSAQEWNQEKGDYRTHWKDVVGSYNNVINTRKKNPGYALTYVIDGTSGHFDLSERLTQYVARYIDQVVKVRLPADGSANLVPMKLDGGFVADLPVPGHEHQPITPYAKAPAEGRALPWYFDEAAAKEAQSVANINWNAESQLPAYTDGHGNVWPYTFAGIVWMDINHAPPVRPDGIVSPELTTDADGVTFTIKPVLLDKLPANFVGAGEPLAKTPGEPHAEWMCGCVEPLGSNRFRVALDRTWPSPTYIAIRQPGTDTVRSVVQPGQIARDANTDGASQTITFDKLADVKAGTASVPLAAKADSGLPVSYFVVVGPAVVKDGKLVFTPIPPRTKLPLTVTVAAWQWGRPVDPKIKRAEIVRQSFKIVP